VKYLCPNCGCLHDVSLRRAKIQLIINKFKKKTGVLLCSVIDKEGYIIASETDKIFNKSLEHKIIALYNAFKSLSEVSEELIDFNKKIEVFSLIEAYDANLKGFLMILKSINDDVNFLTVIPSWLELNDIMLKFEKTLKKLSKCFKLPVIHDFNEIELIF